MEEPVRMGMAQMSMASRVRLSVAPVLMLIASVVGGHAAASDDLYQAQTIVTGRGEESLAIGVARCFEYVLVKVSGDPRLTGDPGVAALSEKAGAFVRSYRYRDRMSGIPVHDEQGSRDRPYDLAVTFKRDWIDAALLTLERRPWPAPRPRLVVLLGVHSGSAPYVLAGDGADGPGQRTALAAAARRFGMPLALPDQATLGAADVDVDMLAEVGLSRFDGIVEKAGGDLALVGSIVWSEESLGWIGAWRLRWQGEIHLWGIEGVSFDDAFRNAISGAAQILSGNGEPN